MRRQKQKRGQSMLEYTLLFAAVVGAFIGIQYYLNHAVQGKMKESADNLGPQFNYNHTESVYVTKHYSNTNEFVGDYEDSNVLSGSGKKITKTTIIDGTNETIEKAGYSKVKDY